MASEKQKMKRTTTKRIIRTKKANQGGGKLMSQEEVNNPWRKGVAIKPGLK